MNRSSRGLRGGALLGALCAALLSSTPLAAQSGFELGAGASWFPSYVYDDPETRALGFGVAALIGPAQGGGMELGYTYVPQPTTTAHSAPRLHALRAMLVRTVPVDEGSPVLLRGGAGASLLVLRPQTIDCGDFPLCSEWAPRRGRRWAPTVTLGLAAELAGGAALFVDGRISRPMGDPWSPAGDPEWVTEVGAGLRWHFGSR